MPPRTRILLVEDDVGLREAIGRMLDASGIENSLYPSAEALLAQGRQAGAACVVSDLQLPGMSGLDLLASLRAQGGWPPVVLITAYDEPGRRQQAIQSGAARYLVKPFALAELMDAIQAAMQP